MTCSGSLTKQVAELIAMVTISKDQCARMDLRIPSLALTGHLEHWECLVREVKEASNS